MLCYIRGRGEDDPSRKVHDVPELRVEHVWHIQVAFEPVPYLRGCCQTALCTGRDGVREAEDALAREQQQYV